jgi:hypothetical protein
MLHPLRSRWLLAFSFAATFGLIGSVHSHEGAAAPKAKVDVIRTAKSGAWSAAATWEGGKVPSAGARVVIRTGHRVSYDVSSDQVIRAINIAGELIFAKDRDTRLDVGLIAIRPSEEYTEEGFDCSAHVDEPDVHAARPALEIGLPNDPLPAKHKAIVRLHYVAGMDKDSCPAIVCCGGRMDLHGSPMARTWVRLAKTAKKGGASIELSDATPEWKAGDRIIVTPTHYQTYQDGVGTEERLIQAIDGKTLTLDQPLEENHLGEAVFRAEVANLSRNVVIESADPKGNRGHTMYHRGSAGAVSYAEFRHLGKAGVLGRYSLHYHLVGDTMRGSFVVGASIWDSNNRWLTVHGTNYLVIRDNVGYKSLGHGYFFEDGTEVFNVVDRNLAVGARPTKRLPKQVLPFDANNGAGFWWSNCRNSFTRNVASDNGEYGFRYEATASKSFPLTLPVQQPDGSRQRVDIRTLPFVRFDDNETHSNTGHYGVNLGEGVDRVGPDARHPFIVRNLLVWNTHYGFRPQVPSLLVENMSLLGIVYGVYHPNYDHHVYRNVTINGDASEPFNRGHDDLSVQYGPLTVDGLTFVNTKGSGSSIPLIQMTDDNPTGNAVAHIRNLKVVRVDAKNQRPVLDVGGGARVKTSTPTGVPVYLHDQFGPGRHAKAMLASAKDLGADGLTYRSETPLTGRDAKFTDAGNVPFPQLLDPIDDLPPSTVITQVRRMANGSLRVRGTTADNGEVKRVLVNGKEATSVAANFAEWEIELPAAGSVSAHAEDAAGNTEPRPHVVAIQGKR